MLNSKPFLDYAIPVQKASGNRITLTARDASGRWDLGD
jgi:hypothetical protein